MTKFEHTPEYQAYLQSFSWHFKRWLRLNYAGHKCEKCGRRDKLQCHHKTYERLFRERISDLEILCENCHPIADQERRYTKALETYTLKRWGDNWQQSITPEYAKMEFDKWLKEKNK